MKKQALATSEQAENRLPERLSNGRFAPGCSGNRGGRPKHADEVQQLARQFSREAIDAIVDVLITGRPLERLAAARLLLERGWGKVQEDSHRDQLTAITVTVACKPPPSSANRS